MPLLAKKPSADAAEHLNIHTITEANFIPYAFHWDAQTLATRNGELLQTIRIPGLSPDQAEESEGDGDLRSKIRDALMAAIPSADYAVWIHTVRRKKNLATGGQFKRDFAGYLDRFWNDKNDWEHQFTNEVYITIVREGESARLLDFKRVGRAIFPRADRRKREQLLEEMRAELTEVTDSILPALEYYGAHRLGTAERDGVYYSEIASFLAKIITSKDRDIPVSDLDVAYAFSDCAVTFAHNAMEMRTRSTGKRRYAALLTIKEYREISAEMLDQLLQISAEFILTQAFHFASAQRVLKTFEYQKEIFATSKAAPLADRTGLTNIFASHQGRPIDFGQHQLTIFLPADSVKTMESAVIKASAALGALGMIPMREDLSLEECYWAQLPANFEFIRRMRPVNTGRIGGFANLSSSLEGKQSGNRWGLAVTTLNTVSHVPHFFNFHAGDNGHTAIIGPPKSGKTVLMNFLLAQACKFEPRIVCFDTNRSSEIFLRSLGGAYYNPYPGADKRPFAQLTFNPFQMENTPQNREFLCRWLVSLVGGGESKSLIELCDKIIATLMPRAKPERTLRVFVDALRAEKPAYADAYNPWVGEGEFAAVFDHAEDTLSLSEKVYGFEMQDIINHRAILMPVLTYLLHRITLSLDGSPTIIVMDEAWALLDDAYFAANLKEWLAMLTTKNAMIIFATENAEGASASKLGNALLPHLATQIYLPDDESEPTYAETFGLSERDISFLNVMDADERHFLLKSGKHSLVMELGISGMSDIVGVLSATTNHLETMDRMIAAHGPQPAQWMPKFLEMI